MDILIIFFGVYAVAVSIEAIWAIRSKKEVYNLRDVLSNFSIIILGRMVKPTAYVWGYWLFSLVEPFKLFEIPVNVATVTITFLATELVFYWYHRLSHEIPFLWALHHTHHSSKWFNMTTAGRLHWLGKFTSVIFFVPLVYLGFSPVVVVGALALSLFYQIFLHTQMVGKLGILEGWILNTPSAHRVHHASNEKYIDKNYGGTLILFDRIFGTYTPEDEPVKYGVTTGFIGHNPFRILFVPIIRLIRGQKP